MSIRISILWLFILLIFFYISWQDYFKNSTDSTDEQVMKKRYIQTVQFYVVLKKMKLMELTGE